MAEPTLSELVAIRGDANLGTGGITDFVPDSRAMNAQIFEAAKFKAQMDWAKYQQQLANFKEYVKDADAISKEDVAAPDREYLQGQLKDIFADIAKNPKSALSGNGMIDISGRLSKLQSDAMQSKQDNAFDKYNRIFLDRVPDMKTDENKAKVETYLPTQKLGTRQPYILGEPTPEFDADALFGGIVKRATRPFSENYLNPKDESGNELKGYIKTESGDEVNPKAIKGLWDLALAQHPKLSKSIQKRYSDLPPEAKKHYDQNGGVAEFYSDLGRDLFNAQFPEGTYEPTKEGNYRFNKKSDLKADPNYRDAEKNKIDWYEARTKRISANKTGEKKEPEVIEQPAILFGNHIDRLKQGFESGKYDNGIVIQASATDPKTRLALGMKDGDVVTYQKDGSYTLVDADGKTKSKGTIDNLAQGFIEAVKTTDIDPNKDKDGTMSAGFQQKSEAALNKLFGTTSGKKIWDTWTSKTQQAAGGKKGKEVNINTIKSLIGKKGYEGYTEQELIDYYEQNGFKVNK